MNSVVVSLKCPDDVDAIDEEPKLLVVLHATVIGTVAVNFECRIISSNSRFRHQQL